MKPRHFTIILLCALIAFVIASWGRVVEWWENMTPVWQTGVFVFCWALLILIGYRFGPPYMIAGVASGPVGLILIIWFYADNILDRWGR